MKGIRSRGYPTDVGIWTRITYPYIVGCYKQIAATVGNGGCRTAFGGRNRTDWTMATISTPTTTMATDAGTPDARSNPASAVGPGCSVPAGLDRALTQVARAILRLGVPQHALAEGEAIDRSGFWLLVRVSEYGPIRLSELAEAVELDLSTVSRQMRDLVNGGLITKVPDPHDGRSSFLSLSARGAAVLESVSEARREALAEAITEWSDEERTTLAAGLFRLAAGLQMTPKGTR